MALADYERPLASIPRTAEEHGFGKTALYSWIASGDVPERVYVKLNGRLYIRRRAFAEWLEGSEVRPAPAHH